MRQYTTDYSNRQLDLEIMQTVIRPVDSVLLSLSLTKQPIKVITGMQKLAQRFALTFLTQLADVHFDQTFGTDFWAALVQGAAQNTGQLQVAITLASTEAVAIMNNDDVDVIYGAIPADEQLVSANLLDFTVDTSSGTIYLQIELINQAGDSYVYVLPMSLSGSSA